MTKADRSEFGDFLRSRRAKLDPAALGLPTARRRRTAGLRREEVAQLAGIGIDWYIRLEQGRAVSPSLTTVDALARALRLGPAEHAHLRALARNVEHRAFVRETVPDAVRRIVESLGQPAYITGRRWDVLAWNAEAADILTDFAQIEEDDRNILLWMFADPDARRCFGTSWAEEARRMVASFRATHDLWAGDPAFSALLARIRQGSPHFAQWWESHDIRNTGGGQKVLHHRTKGMQRFQYATFQANDDPGLKLAIYTLL